MEQHGRRQYEDYKSFMRRYQETVWRVCYDYAHGNILHVTNDILFKPSKPFKPLILHST